MGDRLSIDLLLHREKRGHTSVPRPGFELKEFQVSKSPRHAHSHRDRLKDVYTHTHKFRSCNNLTEGNFFIKA